MYGLRERQEMSRNFFDTTVPAVSLRTLFAGTRRSHGRSNWKFDAALGLLVILAKGPDLPLWLPQRRWAGDEQPM